MSLMPWLRRFPVPDLHLTPRSPMGHPPYGHRRDANPLEKASKGRGFSEVSLSAGIWTEGAEPLAGSAIEVNPDSGLWTEV